MVRRLVRRAVLLITENGQIGLADGLLCGAAGAVLGYLAAALILFGRSL